MTSQFLNFSFLNFMTSILKLHDDTILKLHDVTFPKFYELTISSPEFLFIYMYIGIRNLEIFYLIFKIYDFASRLSA